MNIMKISFNTIPNVLLLGNDINRAYDSMSWSELIKSIQTAELSATENDALNKMPYPMQPIVLTGDDLGRQMASISPSMSKLQADDEEGMLLKSFASLPISSILTTNYTYELEKALTPDFECIPKLKCNARFVSCDDSEKYEKRQLHTYFSTGDKGLPIWHIHGEAARPDTMILGHYYYGKLLSKMQQYISSLVSRYKAMSSKREYISAKSWIDFFMLGDVYIIGLGMDLSEIDIWWLINCKKRHFPERKVYLFKPDIREEEKLLAQAYDIIICDIPFNGNYRNYYQNVHDYLKSKFKLSN